MKIKLFIDFDGTIFDTAGFKKEIQGIFVRAGYNDADIQKAYVASSMDYCYSIEEHFERLQKIKKINPKLTLARVGDVYKKTKKYIFDDVEEFLKNIDREKYEVILFTLGNVNFQKMKFASAGLNKYFDDAIYTPVQKWDYLSDKKIVEPNEGFVIIDDRGDTMEKISKKFRKSLAIEINRRDKNSDIMEGESSYKGIQVKNFKQAEKYL